MFRFFHIILFTIFLLSSSAGQEQSQSNDLSAELDKLILKGAFDAGLEIVNDQLAQDSTNLTAHLYKYELTRNKNKVSRAYRLARDSYKQFKDQAEGIEKIKLFLHRAESYISVGKPEKGFKVFEEAQKLLEPVKGSYPELALYAQVIEAKYHMKTMGMHEPEAENYFLTAFKKLEASDQPSPYMQGLLLRKLGIINQSRGDLEKATAYFEKELAVYKAHYPADHFDIGVVHYSFGGAYYELMEYQNALNHYLPAYEIWKNYYTPKDKYMRYLTEAIGDMYWELGDEKSALPFYNLSVEDKDNKQDPRLMEIDVADSLIKDQQYVKAMTVYEQALSFRKNMYGQKHAVTGACQNQYARALLKKGAYQNALEAYQEAMIMLVHEFNDTSVVNNPKQESPVMSEHYLLEAMVGKAQSLQLIYKHTNDEKDLINACNTALQANDILERLRQGPLAEGSKLFWTQKFFSLFDLTLELLYDRYGPTDKFIELGLPIMENSKAMLLQNALRFKHELKFLDVPVSVSENEKIIKKSIRDYVVRIQQEEKLCEKAQRNKIDLWNQKLLDLKLEYNVFLDELKRNYPKYYNLKYNEEVFDLAAAKRTILKDNKTLLIEYFEGEKYIYAIGISKDKMKAHLIKKGSLFQEQLNQFVSSVYDINKALKNPEHHFQSFTINAHGLYQKLLEPILTEFPDSVNQLFVIPDKQLFYLPFECLVRINEPGQKDYRNLSYLMNDFAISYSQSLEVLSLAYLSEIKEDYKFAYLGFAPDQFVDNGKIQPALSWNQKEVIESGKTWKGKTFVKKKASLNNFINYASKGKIQHFATHALIDNDNPMLSRIIFQGDTSNLLHVYDLYSLPIQSELVILNACNTGLGNWQKGEGMISLERAFQYTGCPALLTSTWSIDDEAASLLTTNFLKYLKDGKPKHIALAEAKQQFLKSADPVFAHPYYWAGLRVTGNVSPISKDQNTLNPFIWIGGLILLGLFGLAFTFRRSW